MSKHVLGTQILDSPYKMIAADANNSVSITTFDMVQIRKVILGIDDQFPNNTSWRFVDRDYLFSDPSNPFNDEFPELININVLEESRLDADFISIKVGDVNGTALPNVNAIEHRNIRDTFFFEVAAEQLEKNL